MLASCGHLYSHCSGPGAALALLFWSLPLGCFCCCCCTTSGPGQDSVRKISEYLEPPEEAGSRKPDCHLTWSNMAPKMVQDCHKMGPRWRQNCRSWPRWQQDWVKMRPEWAGMNQDRAKRAPAWANISQEGTKKGLLEPPRKILKNWFPELSRFWIQELSQNVLKN